MKRWHAERSLMLRRWRVEIQKHEDLGREHPFPHDGCSAPDVCHCYRGPGYFRKRRPLGCGNPRCCVCHYEKFFEPKARGRRKRDAIAYEIAAG
jgi:hypothetical protein